MLLITGTQRTGSSMMAKFLEKCGYTFEGDDDSVGAYDDANICMNYRHFLEDPTFPWSTYPVVKPIEQVPRLSELSYTVAKFPFLMMDPVLVRIWLIERGPRDKLLILVREAEKVVASKNNTPERAAQFALDSKMLQLTPEKLKQNWFDSYMLILQSKIEHRILKFPMFLNDYDSVYRALRMWGGLKLVPPHDGIWKETVDEGKVTER